MNKYTGYIYKKIKEYETIVIVRHQHSDMDALGSQFALKEWINLNFPSKKVYCLGENHHKYTKNFIPKSDTFDGEGKFLGICVDVNSIDRIDDGETFAKADYKMCIDHHSYIERNEFDYVHVRADLIACAELIAQILFDFKKKMNKKICEYLYAGIFNDSGGFFYPRTDATTYKVASDLIRIGKFDPYEDVHMLIDMDNLDDLRLVNKLFAKLVVDDNGFAYYLVTKEELKEWKITPAFANEQISSFNKIEEINIMVAISECEDGTYRTSMRSKMVPINDIAIKYGGGGHKLACGVKGIDKKTLDKMLEELASLLK